MIDCGIHLAIAYYTGNNQTGETMQNTIAPVATGALRAARDDLPETTITVADLHRAAWASSLGSALEYYDFALYSLASALIFGPLFFPTSDPNIGLLASFGTYFLGFAVRPVGGIIFGILGDRVGRKFVLLGTVVLMGIASTFIGLLPTYQTAGFWAPAMLIFLRLLQGLGAGAEQAGAAVLMTEYAPRDRRGFFASLPFMGIQLGTISAAVIYFLLLWSVEDVTKTWLWRLPFLLSVVIIVVAIWIRISLKESPQFVKLEAKHQVSQKPLRNLLSNSMRNVLIVIGLRMGENGGSSIYQALAVSYVVSVIGLKGPIGALCLVCAASMGAITTPLAGTLTDRFGRVKVYRFCAILQLLIAFPVWWIFSQGETVSTVIAFSIALSCGVWGMFGAQGALLPELFGARHRYIGVSVAREASAVLAGGIAPFVGAALIGWATANLGSAKAAWIPIASYVAVLTIITIIATLFTPETRGRDLEDPRDAGQTGLPKENFS
jgi:MFS transporter, MHS family, metabolite:H+ symporter